MVRASGLHPEGLRFESVTRHRIKIKKGYNMPGNEYIICEHRFYSRGNAIMQELVRAIAIRNKFQTYEIVSQNCVVVTCNLKQWIEILKEARG